jgi:hypothetical protein
MVAKRMNEFFPEVTNPFVRYVVQAPLTPLDTGWSEPVPVLAFEFDRAELLGSVSAPEYTFQDLLNQVAAVRYLQDDSGRRYVSAFCRDPVSKSATHFCQHENGGD